MSVVNITKHAKAPIQTAQHVRNGKYPGAELQNLIAERAAAWAWTRSRCIYRSPGFIVGTGGAALIPASAAGTRYRWHFPYRAGPYAHILSVHFEMAPQNNVGSPTDPYGALELATDRKYTNIIGTAYQHWGQSDGSYADTPNNFGGGTSVLLDEDNAFVILTPLTQYFARFVEFDYARIQSAEVHESPLEPTTENGYASNGANAGAPIFDEDRADPAEMGRKLWACGQVLWNWTCDTDAGARSQAPAGLSGALAQTLGAVTLSATGTAASAPSIVSVTALSSSTGANTVAWGTHASGDQAYLCIEHPVTCADITLATPAGFTLFTRITPATGRELTIYYQEATSSSMEAPVIAAAIPNDTEPVHTSAVMIVVRNVGTTNQGFGDEKWNAVGSDTSTTSSTVTIPTTTTTKVNCLVVGIVAFVNDANSTTNLDTWTNANLTSITEWADASHNLGDGGGLGVVAGIKATAGATGTTTAILANTSPQARVVIAFNPVGA